MRRVLGAALLAGALGCGSSGSHPPPLCNDSLCNAPDAGAPSDQYPAPHPPLPQETNQGGPVLASPVFVPITYDGDPLRAPIEAFVGSVGGTSYFTGNAAEYGAGAGTSATPVHLSETPPTSIDDTGIQTWLAGKLDGTHPEFGTPTSSTIYIVYYPQGTTVTVQGLVGCQLLGGYHSSLALLGGTNVPYVVLPRCASFGPQLQGLDVITATTSHELLEAVTDPFPLTMPAFAMVDDDHLAWGLAFGGGEIGDLCAQDPTAFFKPPDYGYMLQRTWSNMQATAGNDPCGPMLVGEVYFQSAPVLDEPITFTVQGQTFTTKGIHVAAGQTKSVEVDLYSNGPTPTQWDVIAFDLAQAMGQEAELGLSLDQQGGRNGQKLHLSVSVLHPDPAGIEGFMIVSSLGAQVHYWPGLVATP